MNAPESPTKSRRHLAGIDVGTTGARCVIFDTGGNRVACAYREYGASYPKPGWVDQDAGMMIGSAMEACSAAIAESGVNPDGIAAIGFSTQRSVTCAVDASGVCVRPMISWQDARTAAEVEDLRAQVSADAYYASSGLPMGTTWIITKILWMRKNEPDLYARTHKFVQTQDLALKAFGAEGFHTDLCDMAFYGLWDVRAADWNHELMETFDLDPTMFGTPTAPGVRVGSVSAAAAARSGFAVGTPICVGAGDQNCSVVGMGAIRPGMGTVTLGTAGLAILSVGEPIPGFGGMMVTNHAMPGMWEVEGLSNAAASSYRWFRDVFGQKELDAEKAGGADAYMALDQLAAAARPGSRGLIFLPYLATAATPRWNPEARAAFIGMSLAHGRPELTRAVMEGVALEIRDMMEMWIRQGMNVDVLRLGGGATKSRLWNQIQADIYGRPAQLLREGETTALGAALLAGVGTGVFSSIEEGVGAMVKVVGEVQPNPANHDIYEECYANYANAYQSLADGGVFGGLAKLQN